ncbi:sulfite exporter TauE/SafE family protein [Trichothermofontia sp.]
MIALVSLGLISFFSWLMSMLAGGGSPLILIPVVNFLLGSQAIAPTITIGMLVGNLQRTLFFWRSIHVGVTLWHLPGTLVGATLGSYLLSQIQVEGLQVVVAIALLLMAAHAWFGGPSYALKIKDWHFLPLSFVNSFVSGLVGSTGPILNPVYLHYGLEKEQLIATKSATVVLIHVIKMVTYLAFGILTLPYFLYGLLIGLAAIPANWIGKLILERMTAAQFRQIVLGFVGVSGLWMLWQQREILLW